MNPSMSVYIYTHVRVIISEFTGIELGMCTLRESTMVCVCDII